MISAEERVSLGMAYFDSACTIAEETHIPFANEIVACLKTCGAILNYAYDGGKEVQCRIERILTPSREIDRGTAILGIIPITKADEEVVYLLSNGLRIEDSWGAYYCQQDHMIVLKTWLYSPLEQGMILLHEAGHGLRSFQSGTAGQPVQNLRDDEANEEADIHHLESKIWQHYGGASYRTILDKAVYRVGKGLRKKFGYRSLECPNEWLDALEKFLGPTSSNLERVNRAGWLSTYAHFEYYERNDPAHAAQHRQQAMLAVHEKFWNYRATCSAE